MHRATPQFWERFDKLPESVQELARKNFALLKQDTSYPSLHFKKEEVLGQRVSGWLIALAVEDEGDFIWVWIGNHDEI